MHLRKVLAHEHDQPWIGHDQRIRAHRHHRLQILEEGLQLGVVRRNVDHYVELLALGMRLVDAERQIGVVELVIPHPQAVTRLPRVDGVGAIGEGITHVFKGAGRGQQLGFERGRHGNELGWRTKGRGFYGKLPAAGRAQSLASIPGYIRFASTLHS